MAAGQSVQVATHHFLAQPGPPRISACPREAAANTAIDAFTFEILEVLVRVLVI